MKDMKNIFYDTFLCLREKIFLTWIYWKTSSGKDWYVGKRYIDFYLKGSKRTHFQGQIKNVVSDFFHILVVESLAPWISKHFYFCSSYVVTSIKIIINNSLYQLLRQGLICVSNIPNKVHTSIVSEHFSSKKLSFHFLNYQWFQYS